LAAPVLVLRQALQALPAQPEQAGLAAQASAARSFREEAARHPRDPTMALALLARRVPRPAWQAPLLGPPPREAFSASSFS